MFLAASPATVANVTHGPAAAIVANRINPSALVSDRITTITAPASAPNLTIPPIASFCSAVIDSNSLATSNTPFA